MRRILTTFLVLLVTLSCSTHQLKERAPASVTVEEIEGRVDIPREKIRAPYLVFKPKGFEGSLPVVYFLHGRGGGYSDFRGFNPMKMLRERIERGEAPFAIVTLHGNLDGHNTYWVNDADKTKPQWADAVLKVMIPKIERLHNLGGSRTKRVIAGISMGAHGAMQLGLNSHLFKCVGSHSLVDRSFENISKEFPGKFGTLKQYKKRDPLSLLEKHWFKFTVPFSKVFLDIGGKDDPMFVSRAKLVAQELVRLGFSDDPENVIDIGQTYPEGKHENSYWVKRMPEYLNWYGKCFE